MTSSNLRRRSFLASLGLGAGATVLGPIARSILAPAKADPGARRCFVLFLSGQGIQPEAFVPDGLDGTSELLPGTTAYDWPSAFGPLERLRDRALLVDGLANRMPRGQHSGGYAALSCRTSPSGGSNESGAPPGGITIDQHIAATLGEASLYRSILVTLNRNRSRQWNFASDVRRPVPSLAGATSMWSRLFGSAASGSSSGRLMDGLREDLTRLRGELTGVERLKMDHYEASLEEFERRTSLVRELSCAAPGSPATELSPEQELRSILDMGAMALGCGMTNVLCVGVGAGHGHGGFAPRFAEGGFQGHSRGPEMVAKVSTLFRLFSAELERFIDQLEATPVEGGGSLFDRTTLLWMSDNGDAHHSQHGRYPALLFGDAGGALRADGRFLRYSREGRNPRRALADLFSTVATAVGAPTDDFGAGGVEEVEGPLAELLR
ncbi:MAG TPA: DUF1552 domain-containing protein [Polyangiaceae bacterium LLY-WYZ-15_(1-7)]|nr:hypothetical protein [Myxococcales bacterium]MBJ74340.1 hypothetical protein [Sandaracinus sp.]HJK93550.1 DUF1552 domain-containing protein [Polyangiaceae bacterium LLY-WYZ-15_(1-7)]HJL05763.1 DUF1552 domain-containing protein [Polyangiaceae bacterium LLY-WYZ-15_(1-7)]HJL11628.1 DUF1552 domain-containing protein [Polyangiaceae bacterium LLY-WYZ-15_(1-7)]